MSFWASSAQTITAEADGLGPAGSEFTGTGRLVAVAGDSDLEVDEFDWDDDDPHPASTNPATTTPAISLRTTPPT
jgi:hypothetical protein